MWFKNKDNLISFMISSGVIMFGDFITKSNRKTPYFINIGNFRSGKQLSILGEFYARSIVKSNCRFDAIFGPAYKGITLAVCCCQSLYLNYKIDKPLFFNRKEKKDHGEGGNFVGYIPKNGENIIIIDDVLTAGTAISEILPILKKTYNVKCEDMFVLLDRCEVFKDCNFKTSQILKEKFNINLHSILNIFDIYDFIKLDEKYKKFAQEMEQYIKKYCSM